MFFIELAFGEEVNADVGWDSLIARRERYAVASVFRNETPLEKTTLAT